MNNLFKILFLVFLTLGITYNSRMPSYDWDMIGYMGSALKLNNLNSKDVHKTTYQILQSELDTVKYNWLITKNNYRITMATDDKAFNENLSYYSIRVFYVGIVNLFYKLGVPLTFATVLPSLLSVFFTSLILFLVFNKEFNSSFKASILALAILFLPQIIYLARLSTPDPLSTLLLLGAAVMYIYRYNWFLIFFLMLLSVLTRTDNIIWCSLLLVFEFISRGNRNNKWLIFSFISGLFLLYFLINGYYDNGGWQIVFYNTFIDKQSFPLSSTPPLTIKDYLITIIKKTPAYLPWFLLIAFSFLSLRKIKLHDILNTKGGKIIAACLLSFLFRYILFPLFDARFSFFIVLILLVTFIAERKVFLELYSNGLNRQKAKKDA